MAAQLKERIKQNNINCSLWSTGVLLECCERWQRLLVMLMVEEDSGWLGRLGLDDLVIRQPEASLGDVSLHVPFYISLVVVEQAPRTVSAAYSLFTD